MSEKLDALWLRQEDPSSIDAPSRPARDFPADGQPGLSPPEQAALECWLNAQAEASGSHDTAEIEPPAKLTRNSEVSAALTNEADISAADRIYRQALQTPGGQDSLEHNGAPGPSVKHPALVAVSLVRSRWGRLPPRSPSNMAPGTACQCTTRRSGSHRRRRSCSETARAERSR